VLKSNIILVLKLGILVTCSASYLRKSYQLLYFLPFMLYMPDSTQLMQEMTSKEQERSSWTKVCTFEATSARLSVQVPESSSIVRFLHACFKSTARLKRPQLA